MKEKINIIFLDIDGVLNSETFFHNAPDTLTWNEFNFDSVKLLNQLTDITNAKIIISSDWRKQHSIFSLKGIFNENKVKAEIIGMTPILKFKKNEAISIVRGIEVNQALLSLQQARPIAKINYVIIDDNYSGFLITQKDNFVKTDPVYGFMQKEFEQAINILT